MDIKELIEEIITEVSFRTYEGYLDLTKPNHVTILSEVLDEVGLSDIKNELFRNLFEKEEKDFKNSDLNKTIKYRTDDGEDKEGKVGNLMRTSSDSDSYKKAVSSLGGEDSEKYKEAMDDLGSENQPSRDIEKERDEPKEKDKDEEDTKSDKDKSDVSVNVFDDEYVENLPDDDPAKVEKESKKESLQYLKNRISL